MHPLWSKLTERLKGLGTLWASTKDSPASRAEALATRRRERVALIKSRPATLEERYQLLEHRGLGDEVFQRLKRRVIEASEAQQLRGGAAILVEAGKLNPGRAYFYLKPLGRQGWLFERSGAGWIVSRAEKIVAQDLFLREGEPIDAVSLFMAADQKGYPRVRSTNLSGDLLSLAVYEQRMLVQMGMGV